MSNGIVIEGGAHGVLGGMQPGPPAAPQQGQPTAQAYGQPQGAWGQMPPGQAQPGGYGQPPPQQPYPQSPYPHPVPPQQAYGNGGSTAAMAATGVPGGQGSLLPSGATVVSYIDNAAKRLPWWFWAGAGIAGYHFLVVRPVWKMRKGAG